MTALAPHAVREPPIGPDRIGVQHRRRQERFRDRSPISRPTDNRRSCLKQAGADVVDAGGVRLTVFTYRPGGCRVRGTLIMFQGLNRDADAYRDDVRPLADRLCLFVAAPLFDKRRFPTCGTSAAAS